MNYEKKRIAMFLMTFFWFTVISFRPASVWADYNVVHFGADAADNINNDTTAVQNALNTANTNGRGVVYLPEGIFNIDQLTLFSNVHLLGAGPNASILKLNSGVNADLLTSGTVLNCTSATNVDPGGIHNWSLRNLSINGNRANNAVGRGVCVYGFDYTIENVRIFDTAGDGFNTKWASALGGVAPTEMEAHFSNVKIEEPGGHGLAMGGPHDSIASGLIVIRPNVAAGFHGILVDRNGGGFMLSQAHVWGGGTTGAGNGVRLVTGAFLNSVYIESGSNAAGVPMLFIGANDTTLVNVNLPCRADTSKTGVQIASGVAGTRMVGVVSTGCTTSVLEFLGIAGGSSRIDIQSFATAGTIVTGTPSSSDQINATAYGGQTGGFHVWPDFEARLGTWLANTKLALYDRAGDTYGLGIQPYELRLHTGGTNGKISFRGGATGSGQVEFNFDGHIDGGKRINTNAGSPGAHLTAGGVWTNASSQRNKQSISVLTPQEEAERLRLLLETPTVTFRYKKGDDERLHIGLIAEHVPDEMTNAERGGIPTADAIAFLVAAMKAQDRKIAALETALSSPRKQEWIEWARNLIRSLYHNTEKERLQN